jgi:small-conductance mechanosensitive channel
MPSASVHRGSVNAEGDFMRNIFYIVGVIVVVLIVLSFLGLR